ncbi:MAG TPA: RNA-binding transcriptional accessory protein [Firmicutes bacterium]|nr:RNA-binding transcriptional accessory protein [Bacillota bacterium]
MDIIRQLAQELKIGASQVERTISLLDEGNTIPFIARYRKEATGELDEIVLRALSERLTYLRNLKERKEEVRRLIKEQEKLTEEINKAISRAVTLQEIEDIYRPFRPRRRTRASTAKEKGLEPLAEQLFTQGPQKPAELAAKFVQNDVASVEEALEGAQDILAERFSDDPLLRNLARKFFWQTGLLISQKAETDTKEAQEFSMYFDYVEDISKIPPHQILAINRGERLKVLRVQIAVDEERLIGLLRREVIANSNSPAAPLILNALNDGYQRLLAPSLMREIRSRLTETAEEHAIQIFAKNLRDLLLQSPVRGRNILGIDPAYRTGCKVVAVNEFGDLLAESTIFPHQPQNRWAEALDTLAALVEKHAISLITIGNGTASRETEQLVAELIAKRAPALQYLVVNEAGASVYSASDLAREEFPDLDVAVRGAISIARRVQDPLAELVKIDPKSIGVGQYQHDVNQRKLTETLGAVVESCVNYVGVELNTASAPLLRHVSGLSANVAQQVVAYRQENGPFLNRGELLKVKGLGPKTFQQAAGFLRIAEAERPLDNTAVHPESYPLARKILENIGYGETALKDKAALKEVQNRLKTLDANKIAEELAAGAPTVRDIIAALGQPGRDPRDELPAPIFREDILSLKDLRPGMTLQGTIQNVVDFGAFVDIGVQKAGLVHISQLSDSYVRHPTDVVQVGDIVTVRVLAVDATKERISLSMKRGPLRAKRDVRKERPGKVL